MGNSIFAVRNYKDTPGTSFHGVTIVATPNEMISVANRANASYWDGNTGDDKTNFDFDFWGKDEDGTFYFTVYDWKEYRPLAYNERVTFHIGGEDKHTCVRALSLLRSSL